MNKKKKTPVKFNSKLLHDCTNHIDFQLSHSSLKKSNSGHKVDSLYESPINEVVTAEFVRGYN